MEGLCRIVSASGSESWAYHCPRCNVHTTGSQPLKLGSVVTVWCCGTKKVFKLSLWQLLRMKKQRIRPNPAQRMIAIGHDAMEEFGSYEYEQSVF